MTTRTLAAAATRPSAEARGLHRADTAAVFIAAVLLFAITIRAFEPAVTDVSARRVLTGAVPYRDFWTMYAPGSIYAMAAAYAVFGVHMMVGKVFGVLVAAAAVAALHRVALRLMTRTSAAAAAGLFAVAFFSSDYHLYLGSYPPAILLVMLAFGRIAADAAVPSTARLIQAGLVLGAAALFKHDVAAYACIAAAIAIFATGRGVREVAIVASSVIAVLVPAVVALIVAGAAHDAWVDLVTYPLGPFKVVRPEAFPLLPPIWSGSLEERGMRGVWWATLNLPTVAVIAGAIGLWLQRDRLDAVQRRIAIFIGAAYPLYWLAAHVQANTHKVTIAALGVLALLAGATTLSQRLRIRQALWVPTLLATWCAVLLSQDLYLEWRNEPQRVPLDLPRLNGIAVPVQQAAWMTGLFRALEESGPPDAPLLLVGWRNDVLIHASTQVFWLSGRTILGRHHELHPAVTDTEPVQRQLLEDIHAAAVMPIVVREHRFPGDVLDHWGAVYQAGGVPVGAGLLDQWVAENYEPVQRFGMYEVMRPIGGWGNRALLGSGAF